MNFFNAFPNSLIFRILACSWKRSEHVRTISWIMTLFKAFVTFLRFSALIGVMAWFLAIETNNRFEEFGVFRFWSVMLVWRTILYFMTNLMTKKAFFCDKTFLCKMSFLIAIMAYFLLIGCLIRRAITGQMLWFATEMTFFFVMCSTWLYGLILCNWDILIFVIWTPRL